MNRPRRLSAAFVKTVNTPGRYGDGRGGFGLSLLVKDSSTGRLAKSWAQRLRIDGQPFNLGLGQYPMVTLSRAREKALENVRLVEGGSDPRGVKAKAVPNFAECLERSIEVLRPGWKNPKTEKNLRSMMAAYVLPVIGHKPIDSITPADVLSFLEPLALEKPSAAKKVKQGLSQTFKWSIAQGLRTTNPADQNINAGLPKLRTKEHHRRLLHGQVAGALNIVRTSGAWPGTKLALEFLVLTAARSSEVRAAEWSEIDLDAALWIIPPTRMKSGREHLVPLSPAAISVLERAMGLSGGVGLVFPSDTGRLLSDNTLSKLLRDKDIPAVPHGFRSSFREWCAAAHIDRQVAESALAHAVGDSTETSYLRFNMLDLRRPVMNAWAAFLAGSGEAD